MKSILSILGIVLILFLAFWMYDKYPAVPVVQNESVLVESYVKANIATLATDSPVLGGSWYVVSVAVNEEANTGAVSYEDGHIASEATFDYVVSDKGEVTISNFKN